MLLYPLYYKLFIHLCSIVITMFTFKPFDSKLKGLFCQFVEEYLLKYGLLPGFTINCSSDGGINLPLTNYWRDQLKNNNYINYHDKRQFRFIEKDGKIYGIKCKENLHFWSNDEKITMQKSISICINFIDELVNDIGFDQTTKLRGQFRYIYVTSMLV